MKKPIISLITLVIILLSTSITSAENYAVLEDNINSYSLKFPSSWGIKKTPNSKDLIKAHINKDNDSGVQIRIYNSINSSFNEFIKWYKNDYKKQMLGHHGGSIILLSEKTSSPNEPKSFRYTIQFTNNKNEQWFIKQYLWPRGNKVYLMQGGTQYSNKDRFENAIDNIANSFKFTR